MIKSVLKYSFITLVLTFSYLYLIFTPPYATQISFNQQKIRITRDKYAIPHIHAPNRRSFLYGLGYILAEDRLFQITFRKLFSQGRLSEFLGNRTLQSDIMMRDLSFSQVGTHIADKIKAENETIYLDMSAFTQGINDQASNRSLLPLQFYLLGLKWQPWTIATVFTLYKSIYFGLSHNMMQEYSRSALLANYSIFELNKIIPNTKEHWAFRSQTTVKDQDIPKHLFFNNFIQTGIFEPLQIQKIIELGMPEYFISAEGSNAWAVSGDHTQSGKPILSGDPHLDNTLPGHWIQFKATYVQRTKTINYAGFQCPGLPIGFGKSDYFALRITVTQTDTQDLYKQKLQDNKYFADGEWRDLKIRNQTIFVKDGDKLVQFKHKVRFTHRGPILNYIVSAYGIFQLTEHISLAWVGFNQDYQSFMNSGIYYIENDNLADLRQTLINRTSHYFSFNVLAITTDNHVLYQQSGLNPIRRNYTMGSYVKDGTSSENDWQGFIPAHQRINVLDPKCGYFASGNNRAASEIYLDGYFQHQIFTARGDRLNQVLQQEIASGRKITNQFAVKLLHDTVDVYCRHILPQILFLSPKAKQILENFDCNFTSLSHQATFYQVFMYEHWNLVKPLRHKSFSSLSFHVFQQCIYNSIHQAFKGNQSKIAAIHKAVDNTHTHLVQFFNTKDYKKWKWGIYHRDQSTHPIFGNHPLLKHLYTRQALGFGNYHTPNVAKCNKIQFGNFKTSHRASARAIFDLGGPDWWIVDGGLSQSILSKHYDDQWYLFQDQKLLQIDQSDEKDHQL